eukprot:1674569-Rhodomonas_salina.2
MPEVRCLLRAGDIHTCVCVFTCREESKKKAGSDLGVRWYQEEQLARQRAAIQVPAPPASLCPCYCMPCTGAYPQGTAAKRGCVCTTRSGAVLMRGHVYQAERESLRKQAETLKKREQEQQEKER